MKAFDRTNLKLLLSKFYAFGFDARAVRWVWTFLSERENIVKVNGQYSKPFTPLSGVPAGCVLSAPLFLIFINDVVTNLKDVKVLLYADDLKIYRKIECENDRHVLQSAINEMHKWCDENKLEMNERKLRTMACFRHKKQRFHSEYFYGNNRIGETNVHKDLGMILDEKLVFKDHIINMKKKAIIALGFIRRFALKTFNMKIIKLLYCSLVRSHIEYACAIWSPCYDVQINDIESIQKKFTIYALNCKRDQLTFKYPSYKYRCDKLGLKTLMDRRQKLSIFLLYDVITKYLDVPEILSRTKFNVHSRVTRTFQFIRIDTFRTNFMSNQPIARICAVSNKIYDIYSESGSRTNFRNKINRMEIL